MIQSMRQSLKKTNTLTFTKYLFLIIPCLLFMYLYILGGPTSIEEMFTSPLIVSQLLIVMVMPFCYLVMKQLCIQVKDQTHKQDTLVLLWIMLIFQLSSMNMICTFLIGLGMYQEYGKSMFSLSSIKISQNNKKTLISLIPIGLVYLMSLIIKIKLGVLI